MLPADGQPATPAVEAPAVTQLAVARGAEGAFAFHDPCVLGTRFNLFVQSDGQEAAYAAACAARAEIDRLDAVFNWRDPDSEISRLNRAGIFKASRDLFFVVAAAERWREWSGGAYSGRLGLLLEAWRSVSVKLPDRIAMTHLASRIACADVRLDAEARTIARPDPVRFDLDGLAKGYIVDRVLQAAAQVPGVAGAMVDIGGDIRCSGAEEWRVDLPAPLLPFDNAPACGAFMLRDLAIATSGCGPRDRRVGANPVSATLDPRDGWPVPHRRSASVTAPTAMDADALATAMLVLSPDEAAACIRRVPEAWARVTRPDGVDWFSGDAGRVGEPVRRWINYEPQQQLASAPTLWQQGWYANITFDAPPKDMRRAIAFRSPYVAIWVSDTDNRPVRTLLLIGRYREWHEGNHVWWRLNRKDIDRFFLGRSMSTRGSGTYKVYWDGIDDEDQPVPPGQYRIHVETSREGGGHSHRVLDLDFSEPRVFEKALPIQPDNGGLAVAFQKF